MALACSHGNIVCSLMSQVTQNMRPKKHFRHAPMQQPCVALQYPARTSLPTHPRRSPTTVSLACGIGTCLPSSDFGFCSFFARVTSGDMGMSAEEKCPIRGWRAEDLSYIVKLRNQLRERPNFAYRKSCAGSPKSEWFVLRTVEGRAF